MNMRTIRLLAALAIAALGIIQCSSLSVSPFCGGGTETGNPGMLECARAVFEEVDSASRWSVAEYLPGGEQRLDPNCLLTQKPVVPLGKCAAGTQDTIVIVMGPAARDSSTAIAVIITRYDTVIVVDTLYPASTVIKNVVVQDTVRPVLQAQENCVVIVDRIVPQEVRQIDTIIRRDTTMVPHRDTFYFPLADSAEVYRRYHQPNIMPVIITPDFIGNAIRYDIASPSYVAGQQNSAYTALSRTATVQGTAVFEKYGDADNDGFLFRPDLSALSDAQFNSYRQTVLPARAIFTGAYTTGNAQKTTLSFLFDAGADYRINSTGDNRILALSRQKIVDNRIIERVTYACEALDAALTEAPALILERYPRDGAVESQTTWFRFLCGRDNIDHRQNMLGGISKETYYRSGSLWALRVQVEVSVPEIAPAPSFNGRITAQMSYNDRDSGSFSGIVDKASGKMYGFYTENGAGHRVTYHRSMDWLEWEESPVANSGK